MPKFDFNNSKYAKMWLGQDVRYVQTYVDTMVNADIFRMNNRFWTSQFTVDGSPIPTNDEGVAAFAVKAVDRSAAPMMDMRSRLGDANQLDKEGAASYLASIPDFITPGWRENSLERYNKTKRYEEVGNDAIILSQWNNTVQTLIDSANSTLSNMSAQLLSTGKIYWNFGRGITNVPVQKAEIPTRNILKAGAMVWTAAACPLLEQLVKLEMDWRDVSGYSGAMKWQMPYDMFHKVFMANAQVKKWIFDTRELSGLKGEPNTPNMMFTQEQVMSYISTYPNLSPIEVIEEKQKNQGWETSSMVHGWDQKIAVLRPVGYAGTIFRTEQLDKALFELFGNKAVTKSFAEMESGLFQLVNTSMGNGDYQEWQTHMVMSAVPTLTEFPYHVLVDTTVAD